MNDNIYILVALTAEDIALLEYAAKNRSEVDWKALKEVLRSGVVAMPAQFADSFQAIEEWLLYVADSVEADCHYDKSRMTKEDRDEIERTRHLAARLHNARCTTPPGDLCSGLKCFDEAVLEARAKEWVSRPRTVWEADYEASETTEDSDRNIWEPAPAPVKSQRDVTPYYIDLENGITLQIYRNEDGQLKVLSCDNCEPPAGGTLDDTAALEFLFEAYQQMAGRFAKMQEQPGVVLPPVSNRNISRKWDPDCPSHATEIRQHGANASKESNASVTQDDLLWINDNAQHPSF